MPIYEYRAVKEGCWHCSDGFEVLQNMADAPLRKCPRCGTRVEKMLSFFRTGGGDVLSARNLREHGFSKFRKTQDGTYEREA